MTARESVLGLPSPTAQQLAKDADKVYKADVGAIDDLRTKLTEAASAYTTATTPLTSAVTKLDGAWEGASADGFVAYMATFAKAGQSAGEALTNAANDLETAKTGLSGAKTDLEGAFNRLLNQVGPQLRIVNDGVSSVEAKNTAKSQIESIAAGYAGEVNGYLDDANTKVGTAADALGGRLGAVKPTFSGLTDANSAAFTPAPGRQVDWKITPVPDNQTTPSGTTQQPGPSPQQTAQHGGTSHSGGGGGGGGGGLGPSGGPPAGGPPPGNAQDWIKQAMEILRANGINVSEADVPKIWAIIQHESGGNPQAINNWDSNAAKGTPSKGLMQCIDPTFNSYKMPGHNDIWNPVDNICAGVNYAVSRYGSLDNVPGIKAMAGGGAYRGY